jgi:hypothetical protein
MKAEINTQIELTLNEQRFVGRQKDNECFEE